MELTGYMVSLDHMSRVTFYGVYTFKLGGSRASEWKENQLLERLIMLSKFKAKDGRPLTMP